MIHAEITFDGICKNCGRADIYVSQVQLCADGKIEDCFCIVHCKNETLCEGLEEHIRKELTEAST
jgi:hypothetical protein